MNTPLIQEVCEIGCHPVMEAAVANLSRVLASESGGKFSLEYKKRERDRITNPGDNIGIISLHTHDA